MIWANNSYLYIKQGRKFWARTTKHRLGSHDHSEEIMYKIHGDLIQGPVELARWMD